MLAAIVLAAAHATAGGTLDVRPGTFGLPADATIVEARRLPRRNRGLVLWMRHPTRLPREAPDDVPYTCPEYTRGSYFSGPTRVSLLDVANRRLVNTRIVRDPARGADTFDVPYRISSDGPYPVDGAVGRPTLLALRDANGDGTALEFALFDAEDCVQLDTALFGYSERRDAVVQYVARLGRPHGRETWSQRWVDHLFDTDPIRRGRWIYDVDYSGRGGCREWYDVRDDAKSETFVGTVAESECDTTVQP